jgi:hypothetical protein
MAQSAVRDDGSIIPATNPEENRWPWTIWQFSMGGNSISWFSEYFAPVGSKDDPPRRLDASAYGKSKVVEYRTPGIEAHNGTMDFCRFNGKIQDMFKFTMGKPSPEDLFDPSNWYTYPIGKYDFFNPEEPETGYVVIPVDADPSQWNKEAQITATAEEPIGPALNEAIGAMFKKYSCLDGYIPELIDPEIDKQIKSEFIISDNRIDLALKKPLILFKVEKSDEVWTKVIKPAASYCEEGIPTQLQFGDARPLTVRIPLGFGPAQDRTRSATAINEKIKEVIRVLRKYCVATSRAQSGYEGTVEKVDFEDDIRALKEASKLLQQSVATIPESDFNPKNKQCILQLDFEIEEMRFSNARILYSKNNSTLEAFDGESQDDIKFVKVMNYESLNEEISARTRNYILNCEQIINTSPPDTSLGLENVSIQQLSWVDFVLAYVAFPDPVLLPSLSPVDRFKATYTGCAGTEFGVGLADALIDKYNLDQVRDCATQTWSSWSDAGRSIYQSGESIFAKDPNGDGQARATFGEQLRNTLANDVRDIKTRMIQDACELQEDTEDWILNDLQTAIEDIRSVDDLFFQILGRVSLRDIASTLVSCLPNFDISCQPLLIPTPPGLFIPDNLLPTFGVEIDMGKFLLAEITNALVQAFTQILSSLIEQLLNICSTPENGELNSDIEGSLEGGMDSVQSVLSDLCPDAAINSPALPALMESVRVFLRDASSIIPAVEICKLFEGQPEGRTLSVLFEILDAPKYGKLKADCLSDLGLLAAFFFKIGKFMNSSFCRTVADSFPSFGLDTEPLNACSFGNTPVFSPRSIKNVDQDLKAMKSKYLELGVTDQLVDSLIEKERKVRKRNIGKVTDMMNSLAAVQGNTDGRSGRFFQADVGLEIGGDVGALMKYFGGKNSFFKKLRKEEDSLKLFVDLDSDSYREEAYFMIEDLFSGIKSRFDSEYEDFVDGMMVEEEVSITHDKVIVVTGKNNGTVEIVHPYLKELEATGVDIQPILDDEGITKWTTKRTVKKPATVVKDNLETLVSNPQSSFQYRVNTSGEVSFEIPVPNNPATFGKLESVLSQFEELQSSGFFNQEAFAGISGGLPQDLFTNLDTSSQKITISYALPPQKPGDIDTILKGKVFPAVKDLIEFGTGETLEENELIEEEADKPDKFYPENINPDFDQGEEIDQEDPNNTFDTEIGTPGLVADPGETYNLNVFKINPPETIFSPEQIDGIFYTGNNTNPGLASYILESLKEDVKQPFSADVYQSSGVVTATLPLVQNVARAQIKKTIKEYLYSGASDTSNEQIREKSFDKFASDIGTFFATTLYPQIASDLFSQVTLQISKSPLLESKDKTFISNEGVVIPSFKSPIQELDLTPSQNAIQKACRIYPHPMKVDCFQQFIVDSITSSTDSMVDDYTEKRSAKRFRGVTPTCQKIVPGVILMTFRIYILDLILKGVFTLTEFSVEDGIDDSLIGFILNKMMIDMRGFEDGEEYLDNFMFWVGQLYFKTEGQNPTFNFDPSFIDTRYDENGNLFSYYEKAMKSYIYESLNAVVKDVRLGLNKTLSPSTLPGNTGDLAPAPEPPEPPKTPDMRLFDDWIPTLHIPDSDFSNRFGTPQFFLTYGGESPSIALGSGVALPSGPDTVEADGKIINLQNGNLIFEKFYKVSIYPRTMMAKRISDFSPTLTLDKVNLIVESFYSRWQNGELNKGKFVNVSLGEEDTSTDYLTKYLNIEQLDESYFEFFQNISLDSQQGTNISDTGFSNLPMTAFFSRFEPGLRLVYLMPTTSAGGFTKIFESGAALNEGYEVEQLVENSFGKNLPSYNGYAGGEKYFNDAITYALTVPNTSNADFKKSLQTMRKRDRIFSIPENFVVVDQSEGGFVKPGAIFSREIFTIPLIDSAECKDVPAANSWWVQNQNNKVYDIAKGQGGAWSKQWDDFRPLIIKQIQSTVEYNLFFDYVFPLHRYVSMGHMYTAISTSSIPNIDTSFNGTKEMMYTLFNLVIGYRDDKINNNTCPKSLGYEKVLKNTPEIKTPCFSFALSSAQPQLNCFNLDAVLRLTLRTPLDIFKFYVEFTDPNIKLTKFISDLIKALGICFPKLPIALAQLPWLIFGPFVPQVSPLTPQGAAYLALFNDFLDGISVYDIINFLERMGIPERDGSQFILPTYCSDICPTPLY